MPNLELSRDLKELLRLFLSHDVRFLVIGGHAVSFHGDPGFTKDLDIRVPFIAKADLISNKIATGWLHDLADADQLQSISSNRTQS